MPYAVTAPRLGGLRAEEHGDTSNPSILQSILRKRALKLYPVYRRYTDGKMLEGGKRFQVLFPYDYADADVMVLDQLSDVETVRNDRLAPSFNLIECFRSVSVFI